MQKLHTFFSKSISLYAILNDQNFNTNDMVSFEQLGPNEEQTMTNLIAVIN